METLKKLIKIFIISAKVGGLTFGGGYAMLPILQKEVVENEGWNTEEEILDYYSLAQCLPGLIMVNVMTFIGHKQAGKKGAIVAGLGAVTPSVIIITIIATVLTAFAHIPQVQSAFAGIRVCVCVLIFNSVVKLWKKSVVDKLSLLICLLVIVGSTLLSISPVIYIILAGLAGLGITIIRAKASRKDASITEKEGSNDTH